MHKIKRKVRQLRNTSTESVWPRGGRDAIAKRPRSNVVSNLCQDGIHVTSPLRMSESLGREESRISILGELGEVCLYGKRWAGSASTDSKKVTRSLKKPTLKGGISFPPWRRGPCVFNVSGFPNDP